MTENGNPTKERERSVPAAIQELESTVTLIESKMEMLCERLSSITNNVPDDVEKKGPESVSVCDITDSLNVLDKRLNAIVQNVIYYISHIEI